MNVLLEDAVVEMRRRFGTGPAGLALVFVAFFASRWVATAFSLPVQVAVIATVAVLVLSVRQPFLAVLFVIGGRTTADALWWVQANVGILKGPQQIYSAIAFVISSMFLVLQIRRLPERAYLLIAAVAWFSVLGSLRLRTAVEILDINVRFVSPWVVALFVFGQTGTLAHRKRLLDVLSWSFAVPLQVIVVQALTGNTQTIEFAGYTRLTGPFDFGNMVFMLVVAIPVLAFQAATATTRRVRVWWAAHAVVAVVSLYLTFSRTPMLGFVAFVVTWLYLKRRYAVLAAAVLAIGLFFLTNAALQDRFSDVSLFFSEDVDAEAKEGLGSGRIGIWTSTLSAMGEGSMFDLAFGSGFGSQDDASGADPHNEYISLLVQLGPLGLLGYLAWLAGIGRGARRLQQLSTGWDQEFAIFLMSFLASVAVVNGFSNAFFTRSTATWLFFSLAAIMFGALREHQDAAGLRGRDRVIV